MNLSGKTIVVMGAAGAIGREVVTGALAAGACVIAADSNEELLASMQLERDASSAGLLFVCADMTDRASVRGVLEAGTAQFGAVDGAVNTAYPRNANYGRRFLDVTFEDFSQNLTSHLGGYFIFMQQCVKYALEGNSKFSLVNMSSIYGVVPPRFEIYAATAMTMPVEYAAIKSGLQHLTRYANAFAKGSKFRANCVSPGGILARQDQQFLDSYNSYCQSKGMLDASDVVPAVLFLLSDAAEFIMGQNLIVDDGFTL